MIDIDEALKGWLGSVVVVKGDVGGSRVLEVVGASFVDVLSVEELVVVDEELDGVLIEEVVVLDVVELEVVEELVAEDVLVVGNVVVGKGGVFVGGVNVGAIVKLSLGSTLK